MAEVFLCQKGQIDNRSKTDLRKAGIIVVEAEDVRQCQFIRSTEVLSGDDMLWACLDALRQTGRDSYNKGIHQREALANNLFKLVFAQRSEAGRYVGAADRSGPAAPHPTAPSTDT